MKNKHYGIFDRVTREWLSKWDGLHDEWDSDSLVYDDRVCQSMYRASSIHLFDTTAAAKAAVEILTKLFRKAQKNCEINFEIFPVEPIAIVKVDWNDSKFAECDLCGTEFKIKRKNQKLCSRKCAHKYMSRT